MIRRPIFFKTKQHFPFPLPPFCNKKKNTRETTHTKNARTGEAGWHLEVMIHTADGEKAYGNGHLSRGCLSSCFGAILNQKQLPFKTRSDESNGADPYTSPRTSAGPSLMLRACQLYNCKRLTLSKQHQQQLGIHFLSGLDGISLFCIVSFSFPFLFSAFVVLISLSPLSTVTIYPALEALYIVPLYLLHSSLISLFFFFFFFSFISTPLI